MALPEGCFILCRPKRKYARKYSARDVGRIACYAREAGATSADILAELDRCVELGKGDCDGLREKVAYGIAVLAVIGGIVAARIGAQKLAAGEIEAAYARAIEYWRQTGSPKAAELADSLQDVRRFLSVGAEADAKIEQGLAELLDELKKQGQNEIVIQPQGDSNGS